MMLWLFEPEQGVQVMDEEEVESGLILKHSSFGCCPAPPQEAQTGCFAPANLCSEEYLSRWKQYTIQSLTLSPSLVFNYLLRR